MTITAEILYKLLSDYESHPRLDYMEDDKSPVYDPRECAVDGNINLVRLAEQINELR